MAVLKIIFKKEVYSKIFRYAIRKWKQCWRLKRVKQMHFSLHAAFQSIPPRLSLNNIQLFNKRPVILPANGNGFLANY
jgi:hypothetical protein